MLKTFVLVIHNKHVGYVAESVNIAVTVSHIYVMNFFLTLPML